jgi:hypothetical protein
VVPTAGKNLEKLCVRLLGLQRLRHCASEEIMKQLGLGIIVAIGLTLPAFGWEAVNPPDGIYQLNDAKSTIHGPLPKSQSVNLVGGKATLIGFAPNGNPITVILPHIIDGKPHPVTGAGAFDAKAETQLDPYTASLALA